MPIILDFDEIKKNPYISSSYTPPQHQHSHTFFEVSFCVSGKAINTINGNPYPFQNGTCAILRPGDSHALTESNKKIYEHIDLYATENQFRELCDILQDGLFEKIQREREPLYFSLSNESFSYLFNQTLLLKEMIANDNKYFKVLHVSIISLILTEWIKHSIYTQTFKPSWIQDLLPKFNDINFVQQNITQIASETGFSLPYFSTQFKKHVGISAIEYLTKKRVHLSKDLLRNNPHLRILDISGMLGFENPSTFSKHFMQEFKLSPKEYRKQSQKS